MPETTKSTETRREDRTFAGVRVVRKVSANMDDVVTKLRSRMGRLTFPRSRRYGPKSEIGGRIRVRGAQVHPRERLRYFRRDRPRRLAPEIRGRIDR
jgi:hypothetical protein